MSRAGNRSRNKAAPLSTPSNQPEREGIDWLLAFLRRDLHELRPGERTDLARDVRRYLDPSGVQARAGEPNPLARLTDAGNEETATTDAQRDALLRQLQATLMAGISDFEHQGEWRVFEDKWRWLKAVGAGPDDSEVLTGRGGLTWVFRRLPNGPVGRYFEGDLSSVLLATAANLLMRWWPELRRCAHCDTLFMPSHGRQQYHAPACSSNARWKKFALTRQRDYHAEYKRRVKGGKPQRRGRRR